MMTRPAEVTEYLRCGGVNCDNACASMCDRLGVEDCKTWRVHGYVQQLEDRVAHLDALNQQNLSVITMQERTRARLEERIIQLESCVPRWISVKEKLPEHWHMDDKDRTLINYLVYSPDYGVDVGNYIKPAKRWVCMGLPMAVTHWMPLPEPPKEGTC